MIDFEVLIVKLKKRIFRQILREVLSKKFTFAPLATHLFFLDQEYS